MEDTIAYSRKLTLDVSATHFLSILRAHSFYSAIIFDRSWIPIRHLSNDLYSHMLWTKGANSTYKQFGVVGPGFWYEAPESLSNQKGATLEKKSLLEVNEGQKAHFWHVAHYCATHVLAQMSVNSNGSSEIPAKSGIEGETSAWSPSAWSPSPPIIQSHIIF